MTIGQARDNFSAIVAQLLSGTLSECLIKSRDTPVAKIVPVAQAATLQKRPFGIAADEPFLLDDEQFDALDAEVAEEFGL